MTTFERVRAVVARQLDKSEAAVTPGAHLVDDLEADSLDLVELTMALEEEFHVEVSDEKALELTTVQQLVDYVEAGATARRTVVEVAR